jgi:predicted ATPase
MINHLYVDNFKCFTHFEWNPGSLSLLLGDNGSGKSSLFDVVEILRDFITNRSDSRYAFPATTLTAWEKRFEQTFVLGIAGNGGQYTYRLVIQHTPDRLKNQIQLETLFFDETMLYRYEENEATLFLDDGSEGAVFPFDGTRSAIGTIPERNDNTRLTWFRKRLERVYIVSAIPSLMQGSASDEALGPERNLSNYVSWLLHLNNDPKWMHRLMQSLGEVLDGFIGIKFITFGNSVKELRFNFDYSDSNTQKKPFEIPFQHLSDGQRCLSALYTFLNVLEDHEVSLFWDEPDNYVSLREMQPFVRTLEDLVEENGRQCILISHHPELINRLSAEYGYAMYRESEGSARGKPFEWTKDDICPADIVARGWEV